MPGLLDQATDAQGQHATQQPVVSLPSSFGSPARAAGAGGGASGSGHDSTLPWPSVPLPPLPSQSASPAATPRLRSDGAPSTLQGPRAEPGPLQGTTAGQPQLQASESGGGRARVGLPPMRPRSSSAQDDSGVGAVSAASVKDAPRPRHHSADSRAASGGQSPQQQQQQQGTSRTPLPLSARVLAAAGPERSLSPLSRMVLAASASAHSASSAPASPGSWSRQHASLQPLRSTPSISLSLRPVLAVGDSRDDLRSMASYSNSNSPRSRQALRPGQGALLALEGTLQGCTLMV